MIALLAFLAALFLFTGRLASVRPAWDLDLMAEQPELIRTRIVPQMLGGIGLMLPAGVAPVLVALIYPHSIPMALLVYALLVLGFSVLLHSLYTNALRSGMTGWLKAMHGLCRTLMTLLDGLTALEVRLLEKLGQGQGIQRFADHLESRGHYLHLLKSHSEENSESNHHILMLLDNLSCLIHYTAKEVLTPAERIVSVPVALTVRQGLERAALTGFSRLPVVSEQGRVIGVFRSNQLGLLKKLRSEVVREMDDALFFGPETSVYEVLKTLQKHSRQMGVIQDAGGFYGVLTMEDILELLVGDIQDEFDAPMIRKTGTDVWEADARIAMGALRKVVDEIEVQNPGQTLAGYLKQHLGDNLAEGKFCERDNVRLEVISLSRSAVDKVLIQRLRH